MVIPSLSDISIGCGEGVAVLKTFYPEEHEKKPKSSCFKGLHMSFWDRSGNVRSFNN